MDTMKRTALRCGKMLGVFAAVMALLSMLVFFVARLSPGDPLQSFYGDAVERMSTEEHERARVRLGLDEPLYLQYGKWAQHALQGEFGISFKYKQPALTVIRSLIGNTLLLGTIAYGTIFLVSIGLAVVCTLYEETWIDRLLCQLGTISYYIPSFWLGLLLILIFNINLGWLPGSGAYDIGQAEHWGSRLRHMILPLAVMILSHVWYYAYMIRNKLLDEVRKEYVLLARVKGLSRPNIVWRHCLRNIAPSITGMMAISVTHVLGGTYVVEAVFSYPGIGALSIESAKYHDYNLLMLVVLITGAVVVLSSLLAQAINEKIDPRLRSVEGEGKW